MNSGLLESWRLSLHTKSASTAGEYPRRVEGFEAWLVANRRPRTAPGDLVAVSRQDVEAWFMAMAAPTEAKPAGLAANTIRSRWVALRSFYGWCAEEEEVDTDPMANVEAPVAGIKPVPVITPAEQTALFKACAGTSFGDRRDNALMRVLLTTGVRRAEVAALGVGDVDLTNRIMTVRGKGPGPEPKIRVVRFNAETARALDRYRRARAKHRYAGRAGFWLTSYGVMNKASIAKMLDRRTTAAGIGHIFPHQFRHTFAHTFLGKGGSEANLQELGGWDSVESMRRYGAAQRSDRALAAYDDLDLFGGV